MTTVANVQRRPPHSIEAERGVLSSMMLGGAGIVEEGRSKLSPDAFLVPAHLTVFVVLCTMQDNGMPLDLITITNALRDEGYLESVGGPGWITELYNFVPTAANVEYYIEIVREKYMLRQLLKHCTETARRVYDDQDDAGGVLEDHQSNVIEIGRLAANDETARPLAWFVPDALKQIELTYKQRGHCTGISTGFVDLDRTMNGFEAPLTYYFAARPAMGKSSLMLSFAEHIAINAAAQKRRVKVFSIEMTGQMLAKRLICSRANIKLKNLRYGFLDDTAMDRAHEAAKALMTDYVMVDEKGDLSIYEFRARTRHAVIKEKCELIMIDYLQRMKGSNKLAQKSRELEINEIAQGISATAKELRVPIVVLAQLNRNPEERPDGKPELGDLRESGSIEQEARFVGLLWRPKYYATSAKKKATILGGLAREKKIESLDERKQRLPNADPEQLESQLNAEFNEYAECIVAKQNEGPTGPVPLRFIEEYARYESQDPDRPLFSTNRERRQPNVESAKPELAKAGGNGERIVQDALEIFPGAKVIDEDL